MQQNRQDKFQERKNNFFFGATSAVITNLGLIVGLYYSPSVRLAVIASMLVIAIADNISDTLGIHVYQEAEGLKTSKIWRYFAGNYLSRLLISLVFIFFVAIMPLNSAVAYSLICGFIFIGLISYSIARHNRTNPYFAVLEHFGVAIVVIAVSRILSILIISNLK